MGWPEGGGGGRVGGRRGGAHGVGAGVSMFLYADCAPCSACPTSPSASCPRLLPPRCPTPAAAGHREDRRRAQHLPGVCARRLHRLPAGQVWLLQGERDPGVHQADPAGPGVPAQVGAGGRARAGGHGQARQAGAANKRGEAALLWWGWKAGRQAKEHGGAGGRHTRACGAGAADGVALWLACLPPSHCLLAPPWRAPPRRAALACVGRAAARA